MLEAAAEAKEKGTKALAEGDMINGVLHFTDAVLNNPASPIVYATRLVPVLFRCAVLSKEKQI